MANYAQNVANKRFAVVTPEQAEINWCRFLIGAAYFHLEKPLGDAREDLFWSMHMMTIQQKAEMAQIWEEYFCPGQE